MSLYSLSVASGSVSISCKKKKKKNKFCAEKNYDLIFNGSELPECEKVQVPVFQSCPCLAPGPLHPCPLKINNL
jgi:hypothetical protein